MLAQNRSLLEWFNRIRSRQLTLPEFQRFTAWGQPEVAGLLTNVLQGLPAGAALILEVGDVEKFKSRTMIEAPESGEKVTEQLLDGQQRLTALWCSLNNKYPKRTYLVGFEEDPTNPKIKTPIVYGEARWKKNGKCYPLWVDDPEECRKRGFIPIKYLCPGDIREKIDTWIEDSISENSLDRHSSYKSMSTIINDLRTKVREFNLPYLSLPATTPKDVALHVFIKMNTSSVKLSTYDIVVALVEEETGKSLHEHVDTLAQEIPRSVEYADLPNLVLDVVALRQDRVPSQAGYQGIDYTKMIDDWTTIIAGIRGMIGFLEEEYIFNKQILPSYTAIPIVAALWDYLPTHPDKLGNARTLLRKFLWRAFLTSRYEQSSTSNALQDFRGLKKVLTGISDESGIPIFNTEFYPVPNVGLIASADWPKKKTILGRGLLALQLKCGAEDIADGVKASIHSITSKEHPREFHHLFPEAILKDANIPNEKIYRAVNCALITWKTNRVISAKDPVVYLEERVNNSTLGETELEHRLKTHLIPYQQLAVGYAQLSEEERKSRVVNDYEMFCLARALLLEKAANFVCEGRTPNLEKIFSEAEC